MNTNLQHSNMLVLSICLCFLALGGCSKGTNKASSTQVAARVNDAEISMHQINQVIASAQNVTSENAPVIRKQILEKLIDQQLIVDKANNENLDRTPDVMMAIEAAKKEILAKAYLQKLVTASVKVDDQEVKKYYEEHPGLFSNRHIYTLQDIEVVNQADADAAIDQLISEKLPMQDVAEGLKGKGIKFSAGTYTRPAEQIPLDLIPVLEKAPVGEVIKARVGNSLHAINIVKAQPAPIDLKTATPVIKNYFINTRGKQLVEAQLKKFRQESKIEYEGDFSADAKPAIADKAPPVQDADTLDKAKKSVIDAGAAGLK